jgi:hypothetical protein
VVDDLKLDYRQTEMFQSFLAVGCDGNARVLGGEPNLGFEQSFMGGKGYEPDW